MRRDASLLDVLLHDAGLDRDIALGHGLERRRIAGQQRVQVRLQVLEISGVRDHRVLHRFDQPGAVSAVVERGQRRDVHVHDEPAA